jgi:hypothetical protein
MARAHGPGTEADPRVDGGDDEVLADLNDKPEDDCENVFN